MNSQAIRESVNQKLIEALSKNILPWRRLGVVSLGVLGLVWWQETAVVDLGGNI